MTEDEATARTRVEIAMTAILALVFGLSLGFLAG